MLLSICVLNNTIKGSFFLTPTQGFIISGEWRQSVIVFVIKTLTPCENEKYFFEEYNPVIE